MTKVKRRIDFHEGNETEVNAANMNTSNTKVNTRSSGFVNSMREMNYNVNGVPSKLSSKQKVYDPCFKNVLAKELRMDRKRSTKVKGTKVPGKLQNVGITLQGQSKQKDDGIDLSVEVEELDYIDDLEQESDYEILEDVVDPQKETGQDGGQTSL